MQQAEDFRAEAQALHALVEPLTASDYNRKTQFKSWTINDILAHLHIFDHLAGLSLDDPDRFQTEYGALKAAQKDGLSLVAATDRILNGLSGPDLLRAWQAGFEDLADRFAVADPKKRVKWAGPEMSARSSISARLMETWSHGQAIYDLLGQVRQDHDRVRNIAIMGINTFGWTYIVRGEPVPEPVPCVRLAAPSGAIWEWNEPGENMIEGSATEFCQVVTQTRNIADTDLKVRGPVATDWMSKAQCFAGPPNPPPAPGSRFRA